jgi:uncharacterized protein (TIGR03083 family)
MLTDDDLQAGVAAEYIALASLLDTLSPDRWDAPSLCEGWRVREVVAHLTMAARYDEGARQDRCGRAAHAHRRHCHRPGVRFP